MGVTAGVIADHQSALWPRRKSRAGQKPPQVNRVQDYLNALGRNVMRLFEARLAVIVNGHIAQDARKIKRLINLGGGGMANGNPGQRREGKEGLHQLRMVKA